MMTWNWPACVKLPFTDASASMAGTFALPGSASAKRILVMQWVTATMLSLPPTSLSSSCASSRYFPMFPPSDGACALLPNLFE